MHRLVIPGYVRNISVGWDLLEAAVERHLLLIIGLHELWLSWHILCSQWLGCSFLVQSSICQSCTDMWAPSEELFLVARTKSCAFFPSKSKAMRFLNSSIWLYWQAHFPSLHQPVKGQPICELQMLILTYRTRATWAYEHGCREQHCTEKEL